jgi:hypothetical protein
MRLPTQATALLRNLKPSHAPDTRGADADPLDLNREEIRIWARTVATFGHAGTRESLILR